MGIQLIKAGGHNFVELHQLPMHYQSGNTLLNCDMHITRQLDLSIGNFHCILDI